MLSPQFLRFALVGAIGFIVDAAILQILLASTPLGLHAGRLLSFLAAVSFTWIANRNLTFKAPQGSGLIGEWFRFLSVNLIGGSVNYGLYSILIVLSAFFRDWPVAAVAIGSLAGLCFNFLGSRRYVFARTRS